MKTWLTLIHNATSCSGKNSERREGVGRGGLVWMGEGGGGGGDMLRATRSAGLKSLKIKVLAWREDICVTLEMTF